MRFSEEELPNEALAKLIGYRCLFEGAIYIKITDWVTGEFEKTRSSASFTNKGLRDCSLMLSERYPDSINPPREIGLFHSHPFGTEPFFSLKDLSTFLLFPYGTPGNVFIIADPISKYFKVFQIRGAIDGGLFLAPIKYVLYST